MAAISKAVAQAERDDAYAVVEKLGFDTDHTDVWLKKYKVLRNNAAKRDATCLLTFKQYMKLAKRANLKTPDQIGRSSTGKYQMGRKGDTGDYAWGNCRFITMEQNLDEWYVNGGVDKSIEKQSKVFVLKSPTGKTHRGKNLNEFAKKHGLAQSHLSRVCRGEAAHHRGWTGAYRG